MKGSVGQGHWSHPRPFPWWAAGLKAAEVCIDYKPLLKLRDYCKKWFGSIDLAVLMNPLWLLFSQMSGLQLQYNGFQWPGWTLAVRGTGHARMQAPHCSKYSLSSLYAELTARFDSNSLFLY